MKLLIYSIMPSYIWDMHKRFPERLGKKLVGRYVKKVLKMGKCLEIPDIFPNFAVRNPNIV